MHLPRREPVLVGQAAARLRATGVLWITRPLSVSQSAAGTQPAVASRAAARSQSAVVDNPTAAGSAAGFSSHAAVDNPALIGVRSPNVAERCIRLAGRMPHCVVSGF